MATPETSTNATEEMPETIKAMMPEYPEDSGSDLGYFASSNEDEEDYIDELAEDSLMYNKEKGSRLFYPIRIGEVLNHRYQIDHKIGHGGFSTVWMAYDLQDKKDVALKVMASGNSGEHEYQMQEEIRRSVEDTSRLVLPLETFLLPAPENSHRVLVLPLMGSPLDSYDLFKKGYSMSTGMSAAQQLLEAVESLHKGGIVHRDLNERNCMWGIAPFPENFSRTDKHKVLSRPLKNAIASYVEIWKPGERVKPLVVPEYLRTESFYLGDFGQAMKLGVPMGTQQGRPPLKWCSLDRLHNEPPSFACDMWSYMCLFAELCLDFEPFHGFANIGVLTTMVEILGPLPGKWKGSCIFDESRDDWYDPNTKLWNASLSGLIEYRRPDMDPVERQHLLSVLQRGFSYCPEERLTATQLLHDTSFRAIIDKYCG